MKIDLCTKIVLIAAPPVPLTLGGVDVGCNIKFKPDAPYDGLHVKVENRYIYTMPY